MSVKRFFAVILSFVLIMTTLTLGSAAKNGPMDPADYDGFSMSYISFIPLDDEGNSILNEEGFASVRYAFNMSKVLNEQPGAVYDLATNTLTLTDFAGDNIGLGVNAMGDDFKLNIVGNCSLAWIYVYGWGHGGSLWLTGDGLLTVNKNKIEESGIVLIPEGVDYTLSFGKYLNADIYGGENAIEVRAASEYDKDCVPTFDIGPGASAQPVKIPSVRQQYVYVGGFTMTDDTVRDEWIDLGTNKNDPEGVYNICYSNVLTAEGEEYDEWHVERYIYVPDYDVYLVDYTYNEEHKNSDYYIAFATLEEMQAAGYDLTIGPDGEQEQIQVKTVWSYNSMNDVLVDNAGNEYAKVTQYSGDGDDFTSTDFAADMIPIPGSTEYIFIPRTDVKVEDLLEKRETVTLEDTYDYVIGGTEFHYIGEPKEPITTQPVTPGPTTTEPEPVKPGQTFHIGDVNQDHQVNATDARSALRIAAKLDTVDEFSLRLADVDENSKVDAGDARMILRHAAKLELLTEKYLAPQPV